jgi:hypothetical protein
MNIAAGWFSHDFLLGFFSLPFLTSALASRLVPIYHPTTSLINPARNERAKNLGMSAAPADRIIAGKCIQSRENSSLSITICGWRLHSKGGGGFVIFSQLLSSTNRSHHFGGSFTHPAHVLFGGGRWRAWDEIHHQETRCCCYCTSMRDRYGRFSLHRWRLTVPPTAKSFWRYNRAELLLPAQHSILFGHV